MKEQLIEFPTAKLAKEKGFYVMCEHGFTFDANTQDISEKESWWLWLSDHYEKHLRGVSEEFVLYGRPTQSLLQKWLRDEHNIAVTIDSHLKKHPVLEYFYMVYDVENYRIHRRREYFTTYEEALEKGLKKALETIKTE